MDKHYNQGSNNSQYGTCWICKEDKTKKIKKEDLSNFLSLGWKLGRIIDKDITEYTCQYCGKNCKGKQSIIQHERLCKQNPNRQISFGNNGNMPEHTKAYYNSKYKLYRSYKNGGKITLDITHYEFDEYVKNHPVCEICGRSLNETIKDGSKIIPKHLCIDHDHSTNKFRGLLCSVCNRQLGWYEKNKEQIEKYLNKDINK